MRASDTNSHGSDAATLALSALTWTLTDAARAERLLALTGLDSGTLRSRADDPSVLAATLAFLAGYEPDLVACADVLGVSPADLVMAQRILEA